jgi:hypothetical protein
MQNLREDVFAQTFAIGAVRSVSLHVRGGHVNVAYKLQDGSEGVVHTKRGVPKDYRIQTALKMLKQLGVSLVSVDLTSWSLDQGELM